MKIKDVLSKRIASEMEFNGVKLKFGPVTLKVMMDLEEEGIEISDLDRLNGKRAVEFLWSTMLNESKEIFESKSQFAEFITLEDLIKANDVINK